MGLGSTSKRGAKLAVKYGPHVMAAWEVGGPKIKEYSRRKLDEVTERSKAFQDAESRVDGSVLRLSRHGSPVFVVFAGDEPVAAYPETTESLTALTEKVDLGKRITPAQRRERQLRARAMAVRGRVATRVAKRRGRSGS